MSARGPATRFVHHWSDHGFFSELNYMFLAILHCRLRGTRFVLLSKYAPVFHTDGWRDFFEPFCPEVDSWALHLLDSRPLASEGGVTARLRGLDRRLRRLLLTKIVRPLFYPHIEVVSENWHALRTMRQQTAFTLSVDGVQRRCGLRQVLAVINREVWRYNVETAAAISASVVKLALPTPYAALHIRRGDKWDEADPVDELTYVERLEAVTSLQDVYVATDDHRCVEAVCRLRPRWRVFALCPPTARGYYPRDFDSQPAEERGRRTLLLLTETEIMKGADVFVGTFSSGIGTYQAIARDRNTYGVDFDEWLFEGGL